MNVYVQVELTCSLMLNEGQDRPTKFELLPKSCNYIAEVLMRHSNDTNLNYIRTCESL